jgi:aryl-alcohol dehydrogenase-like predicted oxidoreductase
MIASESNAKDLFDYLKISPIGLGAWQIGDSLFWNYGKTHQYEDSFDAFMKSIKLGVNFIDTAEVYGFGKSEKIIGEFIKNLEERPIIATKYFPYPWRRTEKSIISALKSSLKRLNLDYVDLYQIHWPFMSGLMSNWSEGLSDIIRSGLTRYVGVSNFNNHQTDRMYTLLQKNGIPLASNQLEYNLINRKIEKNGLMKICRDLGITIIAYSPLAQGLLTGKYYDMRPKTGIQRRYAYVGMNLEKYKRLIDIMWLVGSKYGKKTPAQVAINWLICRGVVPIPGAKTGGQAEENAGALGWRLNEEDINILEELSDQLNID